MRKGKPAARLFVLLARAAPVGIILRRGPSKQVLMIRWDTSSDHFEQGQWFRGRIYERRCDLSPSGEKLIYFAASVKPPFCSWTAISKPPYFTALALWPKGDCWNGGGIFLNEKKILLNHPSHQTAPQSGTYLKGVRWPRPPSAGAKTALFTIKCVCVTAGSSFKKEFHLSKIR